VIGSISLLIFALAFTVTIKYVLFLMRADNRGEGGTLSLMALAQSALGGNSKFVFLMGVAGAALFSGDAIITPAISVMSAIEGLRISNRSLERVCRANYYNDISYAFLGSKPWHRSRSGFLWTDYDYFLSHYRHTWRVTYSQTPSNIDSF